MTMHMCEASITTPTPAGSVINIKNFGVEGCHTWMELLNYTYLWPLKQLRQFLWSTALEPTCKAFRNISKDSSWSHEIVFDYRFIPAAFLKRFLLFCKVLTDPALYPLVGSQC